MHQRNQSSSAARFPRCASLSHQPVCLSFCFSFIRSPTDVQCYVTCLQWWWVCSPFFSFFVNLYASCFVLSFLFFNLHYSTQSPSIAAVEHSRTPQCSDWLYKIDRQIFVEEEVIIIAALSLFGLTDHHRWPIVINHFQHLLTINSDVTFYYREIYIITVLWKVHNSINNTW